LESFDTPGLLSVADKTALRDGVRGIRQVPTPMDTSLTKIPKEYIPKFIDALTSPLTEEEKKSGTYTPPKHEGILMTGTYDEVQEAFKGKLRDTPFGGPWAEMTDGLPVVPPTEERVAKMLTGTSHDPDEEIVFGGFAGRGGKHIATVKKVAINAVMAGCTPEMLPAVLAIAESGACVGYPGDSSFGNMYVASGPYAKEIGMNAGFGILASNNPANKTLERACQLMGINLGGCLWGIGCLERTGSMHWGTIFAENPDTPWETLNVHHGYKPDESILLFFGMKAELVSFQNIEPLSCETLEDNQPGTPAHAIAALRTGTNQKSAILLFTPDTAKYWAKKYDFAGTMRKFQEWVWKNVTWEAGKWYKNYWFATRHLSSFYKSRGTGTMQLNADHFDIPLDTMVPMFDSPESVTIIVAGGSGDAWTWGFGRPKAILIDKWR